MDAVIDQLGDTDIAQDDGKELARHIKGEGVDTEDMEESSRQWTVVSTLHSNQQRQQ